MRTVGIIAEYNPLHNGHQYHIARAKEETGADFCVVALSGDFVQRGEPAVYDKMLRAKAALLAGADLVLEIPAPFATGSAEDFASCSVALLSALGAVDFLCFGSESGDLDLIRNTARLLVQEPEGFSPLFQAGLKKGLTWPQARSAALAALGLMTPKEAELLNLPNHILGVEYCKALMRQKSSLAPVTIPRLGRGYHDPQVDREEGAPMASASGLRKLLKENASPEGQVPPEILDLYQQQKPLFAEDFSPLLNQALLLYSQPEAGAKGDGYQRFEGVSPDLARRMEHLLLNWEGWEGRIRQLKTRQLTYTRVSRCLCHLLLGITAKDMAAYRGAGFGLYGRILGFKRQAAPLLKSIKANSSIPLITRTAGSDRLLSGPALNMLRTDFYAAHLWHCVYWSKYGVSLKNEWNHGLIAL